MVGGRGCKMEKVRRWRSGKERNGSLSLASWWREMEGGGGGKRREGESKQGEALTVTRLAVAVEGGDGKEQK